MKPLLWMFQFAWDAITSTEPPVHDREKDVPGLLGLWTTAG
jgi:hypothetical protein